MPKHPATSMQTSQLDGRVSQLMRKLREMMNVGKRVRPRDGDRGAGGKGHGGAGAKRSTDNRKGAAAVEAGNTGGDAQSKQDMEEVKTFLKKMRILQARRCILLCVSLSFLNCHKTHCFLGKTRDEVFAICVSQTMEDLPKEKVLAKTKKYLSTIGDHIEQVLCSFLLIRAFAGSKCTCFGCAGIFDYTPALDVPCAQVLAARSRGDDYRATLWEYVAAYIKNPQFTGLTIGRIYEKVKKSST